MSAAAPKKSYFELAKEAIAALKERTGSSPQAIKAYITSNHSSIKFAQHLLRAALNKGVETGKFVKVKASFKLAASEKKPPAKKATPAAPAVVTKKPPTKKAAASAPAKKGQPQFIHSEYDEIHSFCPNEQLFLTSRQPPPKRPQ
jgi:histone H1/5